LAGTHHPSPNQPRIALLIITQTHHSLFIVSRSFCLEQQDHMQAICSTAALPTTRQHSTVQQTHHRARQARDSITHSTLHCAQLRTANTSLDATTDTIEHHSDTTTEHQPGTSTRLAATNPLSQN
jgi:hypothetical protein